MFFEIASSSLITLYYYQFVMICISAYFEYLLVLVVAAMVLMLDSTVVASPTSSRTFPSSLYTNALDDVSLDNDEYPGDDYKIEDSLHQQVRLYDSLRFQNGTFIRGFKETLLYTRTGRLDAVFSYFLLVQVMERNQSAGCQDTTLIPKDPDLGGRRS